MSEKPKRKTVTLTLTPDLWDKLWKRADERGQRISRYLIELALKDIERAERRKEPGEGLLPKPDPHHGLPPSF